MCGEVRPIVGGVVAEPVPVRRLIDQEGCGGVPARLQLQLEVEEVDEFPFEAVGAAAVVAEVDFAQGLGDDLAESVLGETGLLRLEETGGVAGRQREGEVTTWASSVLPGAAV